MASDVFGAECGIEDEDGKWIKVAGGRKTSAAAKEQVRKTPAPPRATTDLCSYRLWSDSDSEAQDKTLLRWSELPKHPSIFFLFTRSSIYSVYYTPTNLIICVGFFKLFLCTICTICVLYLSFCVSWMVCMVWTSYSEWCLWDFFGQYVELFTKFLALKCGLWR